MKKTKTPRYAELKAPRLSKKRQKIADAWKVAQAMGEAGRMVAMVSIDGLTNRMNLRTAGEPDGTRSLAPEGRMKKTRMGEIRGLILEARRIVTYAREDVIEGNNPLRVADNLAQALTLLLIAAKKAKGE